VTLPFACLPVCLTFLALGVLGLIVVATGAYHALDPPDPAQPTGPGERAPPWWVFVLIPTAAVVLTLLVIWAAPDW
jgi:hypothetical protein